MDGICLALRGHEGHIAGEAIDWIPWVMKVAVLLISIICSPLGLLPIHTCTYRHSPTQLLRVCLHSICQGLLAACHGVECLEDVGCGKETDTANISIFLYFYFLFFHFP